MEPRSSILTKIEPKTYIISACLLILIAGLWSFPWWGPYIIKPIASTQGLSYTFSKVNRTDLRYVNWQNIQGTYNEYSFNIDSLKVPIIPYIVIHHLLYEKSPGIEINRVNIIGDKSFIHSEKGESSSERSPLSELTLFTLHKKFIEGFILWENWRPAIGINFIKGKNNGHKWLLQKISWDGTQFLIRRGSSNKIGTFNASLSLINKKEILIKGSIQDLETTLSIKTKEVDYQLHVRGAIKVVKSPIFLRSIFTQSSNKPESIRIDATDFQLPHSYFKIPLDTEVKTDFYFIWINNQYSFDLKATTYSLIDPTLKLGSGLASLYGSLDSLAVNQIEFFGPSLNLNLQKPFIFDFKNAQEAQPGLIQCEINFSKQDTIPLEGKLSGEIHIEPDDISIAKITLTGLGSEISAKGLTIQDLPISCSLAWPVFTFNLSPIAFEEGSKINCIGSINFGSRQLNNLSLNAYFTHQFNKHFEILPFTFEHFSINTHASGKWENFPWGLEHTTKIDAKQLKFEGFHPFDISWENQAQGKAFDQANTTIRFKNLDISWAGSFVIGKHKIQLSTQENKFHLSGNEKIELQTPFSLFFKRHVLSPLWQQYQIQVSDFNYFSNKKTQIKGNINISSTEGSFDIGINNLSGKWLDAIIDINHPIKTLTLKAFRAKGLYEGRSPLIGEILTEIEGSYDKLEDINLNLHTTFDKKSINSLGELITTTGKVASIDLATPIALTPGNKEQGLALSPKAPISVLLQTENAIAYKQALKVLTGLETEAPSLTLSIHGSPAQPEGTLLIYFKNISYSSLKKNQKKDLSINDINTHITIDTNNIALHELTFNTGGATAHATCSWALPIDTKWIDLIVSKKLPPLTTLQGKIQAIEIPIETCNLLLPKIVKPEGLISLEVDKKIDMWPTFNIEIKNAATMPISMFGSAKDINAQLAFNDKKLVFSNTHASLGEQPTYIEGSIDFSTPKAPTCNLKIYGKSIPIARAPGIIIRSDIDLNAITKNQDTYVSGSITLRDSIVLMDFGSLKASTTRPNKPPPFFSIPYPPVNAWKLNINISGNRFIKINTPIFNTIASADLELRGTFNKPISTGMIRLHDATINFPFALFKVSDGVIRLEPQDPFTPKLSIKAKTRIYGYDTRLDISGSARHPVVQFTSSPSLSTNQIFAMVSSGVVPQGVQTQSATGRLGGLGVYAGSSMLAELGITDHLGDRLQVSVGQYVTESGRNTVNVDYKINKNTSLLGEYDRYDAFNLDVKWRAYPR